MGNVPVTMRLWQKWMLLGVVLGAVVFVLLRPLGSRVDSPRPYTPPRLPTQPAPASTLPPAPDVGSPRAPVRQAEAERAEAERQAEELHRRSAGFSSFPSAPTETVDDVIKNLPTGAVAFNTPGHMRLGHSETLEAKLGVRLPREQLVKEVTAQGEVKVVELQVSDRMQATLIGGSAFDVSPSGPQIQFVSTSQ